MDAAVNTAPKRDKTFKARDIRPGITLLVQTVWSAKFEVSK